MTAMPGILPADLKIFVESELLTVKEAARILKISQRQVYYLIERKEIAYVKITPKLKRFTRQNLEEYIERQQVLGPNSPD